MGTPGTPTYINYKDLQLAGHMPICIPTQVGGGTYGGTNPAWLILGTDEIPAHFIGFNSITSSQVLELQSAPAQFNTPANVTYTSEMNITLLPGFHAEAGTRFHAYLEDIDCEAPYYRQPSPYPNQIIQEIYSETQAVHPETYPLLVNTGSIGVPEPVLNTEASSDQILCAPNPFRDQLNITYYNAQDGISGMKLVNLLGQTILQVNDIPGTRGLHTVTLDATSISPGAYYLVLSRNEILDPILVIKP